MSQILTKLSEFGSQIDSELKQIDKEMKELKQQRHYEARFDRRLLIFSKISF